MKKLFLAATATLALAGSGAFAADMPVKGPRVAAAPVYSWTGCFVGVAGGGTWGRSTHVSGGPQSPGFDISSFDIRGGIVGVEYGCNWQSGMWVLGTESDFSWTNKRGSGNNNPPAFNPLGASETREHWLSTTRLRAGYLANPQTLLYATGGLATARVEAIAVGTALGLPSFSETRTRWGGVVGGGVEYAFGGGWSAKVDYLYAWFGEKEYLTPPPSTLVETRRNVAIHDHIVRAGVNYKFTNCFFFVLGC